MILHHREPPSFRQERVVKPAIHCSKELAPRNHSALQCPAPSCQTHNDSPSEAHAVLHWNFTTPSVLNQHPPSILDWASTIPSAPEYRHTAHVGIDLEGPLRRDRSVDEHSCGSEVFRLKPGCHDAMMHNDASCVETTQVVDTQHQLRSELSLKCICVQTTSVVDTIGS